MIFQPMQLNDIPKLKSYFAQGLSRTCDNSVGGTFMWRDYFCTRYALQDDTLLLQVRHLDGRKAYCMPLGENREKCLRLLWQQCEEEQIPFVIYMATKEDIACLEKQFVVSPKMETDWSDYLYHAGDLATMAGRRYSGQRNHINRFLREHPVWTLEDMTQANASQAADFYRSSALINSKESPIFLEEQRKVFEVLEHYDEYGMPGAILRVDEDRRIVAFAIGETVNDTLQVHVEKADTSVAGSYQMIVREFAERFTGDGVSYINREDDSGDLGLRTSKLSYHPCEMIEKHTVEVVGLKNC